MPSRRSRNPFIASNGVCVAHDSMGICVTHWPWKHSSRLLARWTAHKLELKRIQRVCLASQSRVWGGHSCPPPSGAEALLPVTDVTVVERKVVYLSPGSVETIYKGMTAFGVVNASESCASKVPRAGSHLDILLVRLGATADVGLARTSSKVCRGAGLDRGHEHRGP